jgi:hypothetical protein
MTILIKLHKPKNISRDTELLISSNKLLKKYFNGPKTRKDFSKQLQFMCNSSTHDFADPEIEIYLAVFYNRAALKRETNTQKK